MSSSVGKRGRSVARVAALAVGVMLMGVVAARVFWMSPPAHAQGGPPAFGQGPFGGPGQGPGGFGGPPPFVMGTVAEVGQTQKMIAVSSPFGGDERIIKITDQTRMVTEKEVKVSEIKVGDQVQVSGVPTGIRASSLTVGEAPEFFRMPGQRAGGGNPGGQPGRNNPMMRRSMASATGKVTAVNPLTIALDDSVSVVIKLAPDARIQKIVPVALSAIKEGDRIMAGGTTDSEGVLTATAVGINMGGGMGGMFGMPFGGPGGPGGPGGNRGGRPQGGA
ncbi:MAG: hypothetical protein GX446_18265, partial [Chthonomonadales bacterium]|nr:hypothetical protein [Chthonomonadales bacterium]